MKKAVTIFIQTDQPLKIRQPALWDGFGYIGPVFGLIGEVMSMEWAFHCIATIIFPV
jgi:hypothetical protein